MEATTPLCPDATQPETEPGVELVPVGPHAHDQSASIWELHAYEEAPVALIV